MGLPQLTRNEYTSCRTFSIENDSRHTHLTWEKRIPLKYYYRGSCVYKKIHSQQALGIIFGKHESKIRRELKREMVEQEMADIPFVRRKYNAEYEQG